MLFKRGLVAQHEAATAHERRNRSIDKEVNAKQERQNSGGGTILGQVWGRLSAKGINKAIASIDTIAIRDKIASV